MERMSVLIECSATSEGPRAECFTRGDLCFHIGEPALLIHKEASQVVLVALHTLHLSIEHHVKVYFVSLKGLAHLVPREDLVGFRSRVIRVKSKHRSYVVSVFMLID